MASIPSSPLSTVEVPVSPRELATLLGESVANGLAVSPLGGGTKTRFGNPLSRETIPLSTAKLNRVLAYEPDDMTISVEAGVTMASVWETLAARGLTIPIDVAAPERETVGGLIATGLSGPRRFRLRFAARCPIGSRRPTRWNAGSAGGMVVKNVSVSI